MSSPVEQIKSRLNIVDVIQSYLKIQKAGVNYRALCPFHSEKTPSFFVSPARDSWYCFGCNRGGDIFSFVMEIEGMEFPEALKILAGRAGVELKFVDQKYRSERARLVQLMEETKNFYETELKKNPEAVDYLLKRGIKKETIENFNIGYAPSSASAGWRNLYSFLKNKNYSDEEIEKSGMVIKSDKGYYDRFRGRIMFPINNSGGQVVGFSGRILGIASPEIAKYINTPQTSLYDKSKILYGFDKAKTEIRKKDQCILVEGQMDVVMSHQAGINNTVAVSGTALTKDHLNFIKRLTSNIIMAFDRDEAGIGAAGRGIDMALADGFNVKVAVVSSGKDPADAIKENSEEWKKVLEMAKNVIEFYLDLLKGERKKIEKIVLPYIAILPSEMEKAHWAAEVAKRLNIVEQAVWEEIKKIPKEAAFETVLPEEKNLLSRFKFLTNKLAGFIFWQQNTEDKELKTMIDKFITTNKFDLNDFDSLKEQLIFEAELFYSKIENIKVELEKLIFEFQKEKIKSGLIIITEKIRELKGKEGAEIEEQLNKFHELAKKLNEIK